MGGVGGHSERPAYKEGEGRRGKEREGEVRGKDKSLKQKAQGYLWDTRSAQDLGSCLLSNSGILCLS